MKKLIIFDLDGTLIDSSLSLSNSINFMLEKVGKNKVGEDVVKTWIGNGAKTLVKRALLNKKDVKDIYINNDFLEKNFNIFMKHYEANLTNNTYLYKGVKSTLEELNKKYILTIATNKPYDFIEPILEYFNIKDLFALYLGGDSVKYKKPAPDMLIKILNKLNISNKQAVMIGDSSNDLLSAQKANIDFIGVCWGYKQGVVFDNCIDDFEKLLKVIDE